MSRIFGRGELKQAILHVVGELGEANGYLIMQALAGRIGGAWQPSPGAIYPALLGLQDAGLLHARDEGNVRRYALTEAGRGATAVAPGLLDTVATRARAAGGPAATVGSVLDRLAGAVPHRNHTITADETAALTAAFAPVLDKIHHITAEEAP